MAGPSLIRTAASVMDCSAFSFYYATLRVHSRLGTILPASEEREDEVAPLPTPSAPAQTPWDWFVAVQMGLYCTTVHFRHPSKPRKSCCERRQRVHQSQASSLSLLSVPSTRSQCKSALLARLLYTLYSTTPHYPTHHPTSQRVWKFERPPTSKLGGAQRDTAAAAVGGAVVV